MSKTKVTMQLKCVRIIRRLFSDYEKRHLVGGRDMLSAQPVIFILILNDYDDLHNIIQKNIRNTIGIQIIIICNTHEDQNMSTVYLIIILLL